MRHDDRAAIFLPPMFLPDSGKFPEGNAEGTEPTESAANCRHVATIGRGKPEGEAAARNEGVSPGDDLASNLRGLIGK